MSERSDRTDDRGSRLNQDQRNSFVAAFLGWTMDAFDYFIVVLVYADIAKEFGVPLTQMAFITTVTLLMRPVGALIFGTWADRVGRRIPLIVDVCFYSLVGFLCAFAPNFTVLLILRLLYGIGMGGEWGLGAALAMEKIPTHRRGFFSGLLQEGYSFGYLLAAVVYLVLARGVRPGLALAVRVLDPAGAAHPGHPQSGQGVGGVGEAAKQRKISTQTSAAKVFAQPGDRPPLRLPDPA